MSIGHFWKDILETINSGYSWEVGLVGQKREIPFHSVSFCAVGIAQCI